MFDLGLDNFRRVEPMVREETHSTEASGVRVQEMEDRIVNHTDIHGPALTGQTLLWAPGA